MSSHFYSLIISEVRRETPDSISVRFAVPKELEPIFAFRPGQYLTLRAVIEGEEIRRNYSLCSAPHEGELRIAIKRVPGGRFSSWANASLTAGQSIDVMTPAGSFTWDFRKTTGSHYVAIAGGSGITPVLSLLKSALVEEPASTFALIYGNRDTASALFLEELKTLASAHPSHLRIHHVLEGETGGIAASKGRLDRKTCDILLDESVSIDHVAAFFICGPAPMMDAAESALTERGVAKDRILLERFTASVDKAILSPGADQRVDAIMTLILDGEQRVLKFDPALGSILDNAVIAGLPAPFSCKAGICSTCRAKVLFGEAVMRSNDSLSDDELAAGYVLTCQAVPITDSIVIDYDD